MKLKWHLIEFFIKIRVSFYGLKRNDFENGNNFFFVSVDDGPSVPEGKKNNNKCSYGD